MGFKGCKGLYHCHQWECNRCFPTRLFWLKEQAVNLARLLSLSKTYAITLKGAHDAQSTQALVKDYLDSTKVISKRYNAKLEYFYAISNHGHSGWHAHIICNVYNPHNAAYIEPVKDRKAYCLYIVANLVSSRNADYQRVRRYGASSLLNKQNLKTWFKTRRRLFELKTRLRVLYSVFRRIIKLLSSCQNRRAGDSAIVTKCHTSIESEYIPNVERPPPRTANRNKTNNSLMKFFTFRSEGG